MAYSNYGAWVFRNGRRRDDRESVPVFNQTPDMSDVVWQRVWQSAERHYIDPEDDFNIFPDDIECQEIEIEKDEWYDCIQHAVLGDHDVRIAIYKDFADIYVFGDKVREIPLIRSRWTIFNGREYQEPYDVKVEKYRKRKPGWDILRWGWIIHPHVLFKWIDPCSRWSFFRNWCFIKPCWNYPDRMEVWMYNKDNNEYWYSYTGMETGSIHYGDKIPKSIRKKALKYMEVT